MRRDHRPAARGTRLWAIVTGVAQSLQRVLGLASSWQWNKCLASERSLIHDETYADPHLPHPPPKCTSAGTGAGPMTRAPAMKPDDRRAHLQSATVAVLRRRGLASTSREIATEAGVAEGTIFRVFGTKDELIQSALVAAFDPASLLTRLAEVDAELPLRERLVAMVTVHQAHLLGMFELMAAVGMVRPPESLRHHGHSVHGEAQAQVREAMLALIEPDQDRLTTEPEELLRLLQMLTFSGSHRHIAHGDLLTPTQIVDVLLDGVLKPGSTTTTRTAATPC